MEVWTRFNEYREKIESVNDGWRAYSVQEVDSDGEPGLSQSPLSNSGHLWTG